MQPNTSVGVEDGENLDRTVGRRCVIEENELAALPTGEIFGIR
jgi:hypothetical protein